MTASINSDARVASVPSPFGPLAGLRTLVRKDATEWTRGRRVWIVAAITSLFMVLTAANGWITATIAASLPPDVAAPEVGSLVPLDNVFAAVGSQIFVLAAVFAVASLLVRERESGTLAWVASKPVTRRSIWLAKWASSSAILVFAAGLVPLALTVGVVTVLYGMPPIEAVVGLAVGIAAVIVFFATVGLAAGTVVPAQTAVVAIGIAVFVLPSIVGGVLPFDIAPFVPASMLSWPAAALSGAAVSWVTPVSFAIVTAGLIALSLHRFGRTEL
jgi:ABC-2 type transport system permease protein